MLWILVAQFYNVASNSMWPALHGRRGDRDRLLCWRNAYWFRQPVRWEMAIFHAPPQAANEEIMPGFHSGGQSGLTVKRIAGLPGERVALAGGDIWTSPLSGKGGFVRQVKPDSVQQGMWIGVYEEDFSDVRHVDELGLFWEMIGAGEAVLGTEPSLVLKPFADDFGIRYLPRARGGGNGDRMLVLPGIPDRYVIGQTLTFVCSYPDCGEIFETWAEDQKLQGRCTRCGRLSPETAVGFYDFRSGLPETGIYAAGFNGQVQGDSNHFRFNTYHFFPDLRLTLDVKPLAADAVCELVLAGDGEDVSLRLGATSVTLNGEALAGHALPRGEWTRVELYRVDGAVRLFIGSKRVKAFDRIVSEREMPSHLFRGVSNGVAITASGGDVAIRDIDIDRDVHYYSGRGMGMGRFLAGMSREGTIDVEEGMFFPLGDNTGVSLDGRSWGAVPVDNLRGIPVVIWRPKERAGFIPRP